MVGALRAEPRCAEQRWVGERGGQGEAPSLLLPGSHCPLGAAGSCGSSRPEAGHLPTLVPQTGSRGSLRADHCSPVNHQRHLDFVCWPGSLLPIPWAAPLRQPCTGPQGWWLRPWVAVIGGEVGLWVWGSLRHRSDGGSGGGRGWSARRGQQWGNRQGGRLLGALGLPQEALVALEVGRALWQQVIVGAADLPAITDNGQDAGASPWARSLDHLWSGVLRV